MNSNHNSHSQPKVAICQSTIAPGGRLHVLLAIVKVLNDMGIVPDILTGNLCLNPHTLDKLYGDTYQLQFRCLPRVKHLSSELSITFFNAILDLHTKEYDLLINSSNSLLFLPKSKLLMSYVHFPREGRIAFDGPNIHLPHQDHQASVRASVTKRLARQIYRLRKIHPQHTIICNSEFTRSALQQEYELRETPLVFYPPVNIKDFQHTTGQKEFAIVSIGRFSPNKRQLEQVQLAQTIPEIPFHIIGFANGNSYYQKCKNYVAENKLENVYLHADISFERMITLLKKAKFFLHTLVNEPFGITTVQAIAAGCLPIVHDSGGQREIVPCQQLRYQDLSEIPAILKYIADSSVAEQLTIDLSQHIQQYDATLFYKQMRAYLQAELQHTQKS